MVIALKKSTLIYVPIKSLIHVGIVYDLESEFLRSMLPTFLACAKPNDANILRRGPSSLKKVIWPGANYSSWTTFSRQDLRCAHSPSTSRIRRPKFRKFINTVPWYLNKYSFNWYLSSKYILFWYTVTTDFN